MQNLLIVGAGGCGRELMLWAEDSFANRSDITLRGFLDDNSEALASIKSNYGILGSISSWQPTPDQLFICGIADPTAKKRIVEMLKNRGASFISMVHPTALIARTATLGKGVVIAPYSIISDNAVVDGFVFVNKLSSIGHDAKIGEYSTVNSYCDITGGVELGSRVFVGSHVSIIPKTRIGDGAFLCAGSVVMNNIKPGIKVLGNPAKKTFL